MWSNMWLGLLSSLDRVERQKRLRSSAKKQFMKVNRYVELGKKGEIRKRGLNAKISDEELEELKMGSQRYCNASTKLQGAELSLRLAKRLMKNAVNEILTSVGKEIIDEDMTIVTRLVRESESARGQLEVHVYYAPTRTLVEDCESSIFKVKRGHICITSDGITYLRRYSDRRGSGNHLTKPLRSPNMDGAS